MSWESPPPKPVLEMNASTEAEATRPACMAGRAVPSLRKTGRRYREEAPRGTGIPRG
jgi:hypothetical protein